MHSRYSHPHPSRRGLTLIEVLVVLFIFAILLTLVMSHLSSPRTSRRIDCLSNIRNVGMAMQTFASANNGQLPCMIDSAGYNWPVQLLGQLDQSQLITAGPKYFGNNLNANSVGIKVLTCPTDYNNFGSPFGLSYVVNAGAGQWTIGSDGWAEQYAETGPNDEFAVTRLHWGDIDWDGGGITRLSDLEIAHDTGVFHRAYFDGTPSAPGAELGPFRMTLDQIQQNDGQTQTLLLGENKNAMNWGYSTLGSATGNGVIQTAFTINGSPATGDVVFAGTPESPLAIASIDAAGNSWINAARGRQGATPTLSSNHPGVVNVIFCDGSARQLSETIDRSVYVRLMSSGGVRRGQLPQITSDDY